MRSHGERGASAPRVAWRTDTTVDPVAVTAVEAAGSAFTASYQCREHAEERWRYARDGEQWDRVG